MRDIAPLLCIDILSVLKFSKEFYMTELNNECTLYRNLYEHKCFMMIIFAI